MPQSSLRMSHVSGQLWTSSLPQWSIFLTMKKSQGIDSPWRNNSSLFEHMQKSPCLPPSVKILHSRMICHNQEVLLRKISWLGSQHLHFPLTAISHGEWWGFGVCISVYGMQCMLWALCWYINHYSQKKVKTQTRCCVPKTFESISNLPVIPDVKMIPIFNKNFISKKWTFIGPLLAQFLNFSFLN